MASGSHAFIPEKLGRYRIIRPLSKGGMALVYEARREADVGSSAKVALKVILPDYANNPAFQEMFVHEARMGAAMHHKNVVQILDFDIDNGTYYLVMEYVDGFTVSRMIGLTSRRQTPIPMTVVAEIGRQACDGLHFVHSAVDGAGRALGLVHRDIKPSNLMITPDGAIKVLDFGVAKGRQRAELGGSVRGTWGYMSPEQAMGTRVTTTADIFSLGIVLYEMASQRTLFKGLGEDRIRQMLEDNVAPEAVSSLDPSYGPLIPVLQKALAHAPEDRYATAADMGRALAELLPDPITTRGNLEDCYRLVHEFHREERQRRKQEAVAAAGDKSVVVDPAPPARSHQAVAPVLADEDDRTTVAISALLGVAVVMFLSMIFWFGLQKLTGQPSDSAEVTVGAVQTEALPPITPAAGPPTPSDADANSGENAILVLSVDEPAEAYIDGQLWRGPLDEITLSPGTHLLSILAADGRRSTSEITVEAGKKKTASWSFERNTWLGKRP